MNQVRIFVSENPPARVGVLFVQASQKPDQLDHATTVVRMFRPVKPTATQFSKNLSKFAFQERHVQHVYWTILLFSRRAELQSKCLFSKTK